MVARQRLAVFSCSAVWITVPPVQTLWIRYACGSLLYVWTMAGNRPAVTPARLFTGMLAECSRLSGFCSVAFEAAGAADTPQPAVDVACAGGKVILVGIPSDDRMTIKASTARHKGLVLKPVFRMKHANPRAIRLVQTGMVNAKPLATHMFPLERIGEAFELVTGYEDGVLRAVIQIF